MSGEQVTRKSRKHRQGKVLKNKMNKGIIVWVERKLRHPLYEKVVRIGKKYYVHDEKNEAGVDDIVEIAECRPVSKLKRWRLVSIVRKAPAPSRAQVAVGEEEA